MALPSANKVPGDTGHTTDHNAIVTEILAIQAELGANPSGAAADVATRFANMDIASTATSTLLGNSTTLLNNGSGQSADLAARLSGMEAKLVPTSGTNLHVLTKGVGTSFGWAAATGGGGAASITGFYDAGDYGVASTNNAYTNGAALRSLVSTAVTNHPGGYHIRMPKGVIELDTVANSGPAGGWCCVAIHSNSTLEVPGGCTMKLMGNSAQGAAVGTTGTVNNNTRMVTNAANAYTNISLIGSGTIDGNAQALETDSRYVSGGTCECATIYGVMYVKIDGLTFKDAHSTYGNYGEVAFSTGTGRGNESFCLDTHHCSFVRVTNCKFFSTATRGLVSGGYTPTEVSHGWIDNCWWDNVDVQGMSCYGSNNLVFSNCIATRNYRGFNFEHSQQIYLINCMAGGYIRRDPEGSTAQWGNQAAWSDGQNMANTSLGRERPWNGGTRAQHGVGFHIIFGGPNGPSDIPPSPGTGQGKGGANYHFINCVSQGHNNNTTVYGSTQSDCGLSFSDSASFTAGTATSGTTIIGCDRASRGQIGSYVTFQGDRMYRITAVSSTTMTVTPALTTTQTGNVCYVVPAPITFTNCQFLDNYYGMQIYAVPYSAPIARAVKFTNCLFEGNTTDVASCGNQTLSTNSGSIADAEPNADVSTAVGMAVNGTVLRNPIPFPIKVHAAGVTAASVGGPMASTTGLTALPVSTTSATPATGLETAMGVVLASDTGALPGTTYASIPTFTTTLTSQSSLGRIFRVQGVLMYTADATQDMKLRLSITPSISAEFNMFTTFRGPDAGLAWITDDDQVATLGTPQSTPLYSQDFVCGGNGTNRRQVSFDSTITLPGNMSMTFTVDVAENAGASAGLNVRGGSNIIVTPLNGGLITNANGYHTGGGDGDGVGLLNANLSFDVPPNGLFSLTASSAKALIAST